MAKKPLGAAPPSRLAGAAEEGREASPKSAPLTLRAAPAPKPRSFRLKPSDLQRLSRLTKTLSEAAGRPITTTEVLKGVLLLSEQSAPEAVLVAIRDAVFEGGR